MVEKRLVIITIASKHFILNNCYNGCKIIELPRYFCSILCVKTDLKILFFSAVTILFKVIFMINKKSMCMLIILSFYS